MASPLSSLAGVTIVLETRPSRPTWAVQIKTSPFHLNSLFLTSYVSLLFHPRRKFDSVRPRRLILYSTVSRMPLPFILFSFFLVFVCFGVFVFWCFFSRVSFLPPASPLNSKQHPPPPPNFFTPPRGGGGCLLQHIDLEILVMIAS